MKVGILTWYQAINHGAVLQTYASCQMLKELDCDPVVLDYNWSLSDENDKKIIRYIRRLRNFSPKKLVWYMHVKDLFREKSENFSNFIKDYLPVGKMYKDENGLDAVYIGSDMVFDITEGYNPYMYGFEVPSDYIFSYAASFGYTTYESLKNNENHDKIIASLKKLKAIGYRDQNTLQLCKKNNIKVPMTENIDPVLAYGFKNEIENWDTGKWKNRKYILIYSYDSTMNDKETINAIRDVAKEEGLELISCGYYHKWCDSSLPTSPVEFIEMVKHAKYVITDTFHGTVFSLLMHKQLASIVLKNGFKLRYLLEQIGMASLIAENPEMISAVLHCKADYTNFDNWLEKNSAQSKSYIAENIMRARREMR